MEARREEIITIKQQLLPAPVHRLAYTHSFPLLHRTHITFVCNPQNHLSLFITQDFSTMKQSTLIGFLGSLASVHEAFAVPQQQRKNVSQPPIFCHRLSSLLLVVVVAAVVV